MTEFHVTVIGSLNADLSIYTNVMPKLGETVTGSNFLLGYGGKGANQCVASKILGCKTALVGKVGEDYFGEMFIQYLKQLDVNTDGVTKSSKCGTGVASITVEVGTGGNQIIIVPGANMLISEDDINLAEQQLMLFNTKVIICQFEISPLATLHSLRLGRAHGVKTILNPAPAPTPSKNLEVGNYELLEEILSNSDFVCLNESEFCSITGSDAGSFLVKDESITSSTVHTFIPGLKYLLEKEVKWPIVTLGNKGVIATFSGENMTDVYSEDVNVMAHISVKGEEKLVVHLAAPEVANVADTAGAGDCFVGSLAYFVACHEDITLVEQIRRSVWIASQSVRKRGTQSSYLKRNELPSTVFGTEMFSWL